MIATTPNNRYYTRDQAAATLPYVSRIACDIIRTHETVVIVRRQIQRVELGLAGHDIQTLNEHYAELMTDLRRFVRELDEINVYLEDFEVGVVQFPSETFAYYWCPGVELTMGDPANPPTADMRKRVLTRNA